MEIKSNEIKMVDIDSIIPNKKNNNKHSAEQIDRLCKIIKHNGFRVPLIISNRSGFLICGHGRKMAAKKLGITELPVVYQDFENEAEEFQFLTADNEISRWAEFDKDQFDIDLKELGLDDDFDLELFGLPELDIPVEVLEPQGDEDAVPELKPDPIAKRGDVWILGNHRLMCGDSTMIDDVEKLMDGHQADMVFTDPPYGVDYKGINNDDRGGLSELLNSVFANYLATSKSGASIYCFHSDRCGDIFHTEFRKFFHFSSMIIWNKNSLTLSQTDYQSKHEPCMYGWMDNGTHSFYGDRKQLSVWDVHKEHVKGHTTPKPIEVIDKALANSSKGGDLITDFFLGSGSTLICAEKNGRVCYGMELDEQYVDVIIKRWQDYTGKDAILEASGETYNSMVVTDG